MGGIQYRLDQPLIPPEAELIDDQGQDNGDGEGPQQAVQADEDGIEDKNDLPSLILPSGELRPRRHHPGQSMSSLRREKDIWPVNI